MINHICTFEHIVRQIMNSWLSVYGNNPHRGVYNLQRFHGKWQSLSEKKNEET